MLHLSITAANTSQPQTLTSFLRLSLTALLFANTYKQYCHTNIEPSTTNLTNLTDSTGTSTCILQLEYYLVIKNTQKSYANKKLLSEIIFFPSRGKRSQRPSAVTVVLLSPSSEHRALYQQILNHYKMCTKCMVESTIN
jgi:hypothetical protein